MNLHPFFPQGASASTPARPIDWRIVILAILLYLLGAAGTSLSIGSAAAAQPSPTPSPTPDGWALKWEQPPNMIDGFDVPSLVVPQDKINIVVADDWECTDPNPVIHVTWWGSYIGWMEETPDKVDPPPVRPIAFRLSWHEYIAEPFSHPGTLIKEEIANQVIEEYYGPVPQWQDIKLFEHEYIYQWTLREPWPQEEGKYYFLDIQAIYNNEVSQLEFPWGWKNCEKNWNDDAVQSLNGGETWAELIWPKEHRLEGESMDMSFLLWVQQPVVTPTPTPPPTLTPTPEPTETPGPTPTPIDWKRKWSQPPNMIDGFDVPSYRYDPANVNLIVADDWECNDPDPVVHITWWGSYANWMPHTPFEVPPPPDHPMAFRLSWHEYIPEPPYSRPGELIKVEICTNYTVQWFGAVPMWNSMIEDWEHEYIYQCTLREPWPQEPGKYYFLDIQAIYPIDDPTGANILEHPWGWKNSEEHWNDDAVQWQTLANGNQVWVELFWPDGHRLQGNSMDMAFELWTAPVPVTPTPTPTPEPTETPEPTITPEPTPTPVDWVLKWGQPPNMLDGFNVPSFRAENIMRLVADDWQCTDPNPVVHIRWWGSYLSWLEQEPGPVPPPQIRPAAFRLSWHEYLPGPPYSMPGPLIRAEICTDFTEAYFGPVPIWNNPNAVEHEYIYSCTLKEPWFQQEGKTYFLDVQAIYPIGVPLPLHPWGWKNSEFHWNDDAVTLDLNATGAALWKELFWPDGHRLQGQSMDMAFELWVAPVPTPTPSPTPEPTLTPEPTPSPSPTPEGWDRKWLQPPNMIDGFDVLSSLYEPGGIKVVVADDWECNDPNPVLHIVWWGSYIGWKEETPLPVPPPPYSRPVAFRLSWHEYLPGPPYSMPGALLKEEICRDFTEEWFGPVPIGIPGTIANFPRWEHEYIYHCTLQEPWPQEPGTKYFLDIQAIYQPGTVPPEFLWGWKNSEVHWNDDAVQWQQIATTDFAWIELIWPANHRLAGQSMDMAFEIWTGPPTPTPTPTPGPSPTPPPPTPTPTPSPTPTPLPADYELKWEQQPNLIDGFDIPSFFYAPDRISVIVADDWECNSQQPVIHVTWWGSHKGWMMDSPDRVPPPPDRPAAFRLSWHEYIAEPFSHPGKLLRQEICQEFSIQWVRAVPVWQMPDLWEHEYIYQQRLKEPWPQEPGTKYFLDIQALYPSNAVRPRHVWGWLNSEKHWNDDAVLTKDWGTTWMELLWPLKHRLGGQSMDMAFLLWTSKGPGPTPTPTATPLPTPDPGTPPWQWVRDYYLGRISLTPGQFDQVDMDKNGLLNVADIILILLLPTPTPTPEPAAPASAGLIPVPTALGPAPAPLEPQPLRGP